MSVLVWGVFEDGERAREGVEALIEASFPPDEIKLLMKKGEGELEDVPIERKTAVPEGAAVGASLGAVGAAGAVLLTGGGALVAAGPVAAVLKGAGVGAAFGAMGGLGWWKEEADVPERADERADTRVLVFTPVPAGREADAERALQEAGASEVGTLGPEAAARVGKAKSLADEVQREQGESGSQK